MLSRSAGELISHLQARSRFNAGGRIRVTAGPFQVPIECDHLRS